MKIKFLIFLKLILIVKLHDNEEEIQNEVDKTIITYGSAAKIKHFATGYYLHSGDISFERDSNEKVVSATFEDTNQNLLFQIKEKFRGNSLGYNDVVKCGDVIRLEHTQIKANIHLSKKSAIISGKTRISLFGENGNGNYNDNWRISCIDKEDKSILYGSSKFYLINEQTNQYIFTSNNYYYNQNNCGYRCPILNNLEVSAIKNTNNFCIWQFDAGVIFDIDQEEFNNNNRIVDDEL